MTMADEHITELTADLVSAFVSNNSIPTAQLTDLIASVFSALNILKRDGTVPVEVDKPVPAVPVKKSVTPNSITCLVCGKPHKSLKRHISTSHGFTPQEYRAAYNLSADYPMVAPQYAAQRSTLAKTMGLGRKRDRTAEPVAKAKPTKLATRGRLNKAVADAVE